MDIISRISQDLESEGVVLSNAKILKLVHAIRPLAKVYYQIYTKKAAEEDPVDTASINERITYQLQTRTSLKEGIVQTLVQAIQGMLEQQLQAVKGSEEGTPAEVCKKLF